METEEPTTQAPNPQSNQGATNEDNQQGTSNASQQVITQEEVQGFIQATSEFLPNIPKMQQAELDQVRALIQHVNTCQKNIMQRMSLMPHIAQVEIALQKRDNPQVISQGTPTTGQESEKSLSTQVNSQSQVGQYIEFYHLFQYQSELDQQNIRESASSISPQAQKQLREYNQTGLIERTKRNKIINIPIQQLFVRVPMTVQQLTKDQCQYIQTNINIDKNTQMRDFPYFNPDFQFRCTLFGVSLSQNFGQFEQWTTTHQSSQLNLPQNKGLNFNEVEGRFAFETGCRWIEQKFSEYFNPDWNERVAFYLANGYQPSGRLQEDTIRVSCLRCINVGAWDGMTTYYRCPTAKAMGKAVNNLRNLSIYLTSGKHIVRILNPQAIKVDISTLPQPKDYENIITLHNSWCNLTKRQLVNHLQERFSPCIMLGAVFLPNFTCTNFGVAGKLINMMPRFVNSIPEDSERELFNWSFEKGAWILNGNLQLSMYQNYTNTWPTPLEQQESEHLITKKFSNQVMDPYRAHEYGSNHFWTWYKRDRSSNQISSTPMSIYSEFKTGENPYNPTVTSAAKTEQLMLPKKLSPQNTQTCYSEYIDNTCYTSLEMALRFRRAQLITGFNAPYLRYQDFGDMRTVEVRIPTIFEFITRPLSQQDLDSLRKMKLVHWQWIPREMISQFDEETGLTRNKREMANVRIERLNEEAQAAQQEFYNSKRTFSTVSPKNRKKNKGQS